MKLKNKTLIIICSIAIFIAGCSPYLKKDFSLYENDSKQIVIQYPLNWELRKNQEKYILFMAVSPPDSNDDLFRENVNIVSEMAPDFTLEKYYQANLRVMIRELAAFKIIGEGSGIINNQQSKWLIYEHQYNNQALKVKAYFFYKDDSGIVYTATANQETFKKYEPAFDEIVSTLKIK